MSSDRIASLAMYRDPPEIAAATRALWAHLRDSLRDGGLADIPEQLDETITYDAAWLDPRLLLAQTCGYPFVKRLRGRVRLVATPVYDRPGCDGPLNGSFVIVAAEAPVASIEDLRGRTAAINDRMSNSGMNLLRRFIAPYAVDGRFFGRVIESGGHVASLAMVANGEADVAAIDCVTHGNLARFAPERVAGVRILAETVKTPGLPLITRATASDGEVAALCEAFRRLSLDLAAASIRDTLGFSGFETLPQSAYGAVQVIEDEAVALGYAVLS